MFLPLLVVLEHMHWGVGSRASQGGVSIRQVRSETSKPPTAKASPPRSVAFSGRDSPSFLKAATFFDTNWLRLQNGGHVQRALQGFSGGDQAIKCSVVVVRRPSFAIDLSVRDLTLGAESSGFVGRAVQKWFEG